ncbi:DUF2180 family protein [Streptomyces cacaoi]|uniref:DUF2180 family protein n=1 Tax=Streptomyces cacaoi TaxID=1898 RepID=UPI0011F2D0F0|nr:DUF2180 family protein [Streptomyces cacaoi]
MHCYDCHQEGKETTALAVCRDCGAGVCSRHLRPDPEPVRRSTSSGQVWSGQESRRMICEMCHRTYLNERGA